MTNRFLTRTDASELYAFVSLRLRAALCLARPFSVLLDTAGGLLMHFRKAG